MTSVDAPRRFDRPERQGAGATRQYCQSDPSRRWLSRVATPLVLSRLVLCSGILTVLSAASPAIQSRVQLLTQFLPGVFPAAATTGALAVGCVMIVVAGAIRRGKYRGWLLCVALASATIVLDLVKGLDVEESLAAAVLLVLLLVGRRQFRSRPDPRSVRRVLVLAICGPLLATVLGTIWLTSDVVGQAPRTTWTDRVAQAGLGLAGVAGPINFTSVGASAVSSTGLAVLGAASLLVVCSALVRPLSGPRHLSTADDRTVRELIRKWGHNDSLSYFATRSDRSLILSPTAQAGITYRVIGAVSLAAGDPIGNPAAWSEAIATWLAECRAYGWSPAVLGASERAAEAFRRAGLDALELGDEAVLDARTFTLVGRDMRGVRHAVGRCGRAGLSVRCARLGDIRAAERDVVSNQLHSWRGATVERGYSMALGRFMDGADPDTVVVTANDATGKLHGVLSLVPWGQDGLSLDVMQRDPNSVNGVVEFMIAGLCRDAAALGIANISLNFAIFRSAFARADRVGAGPVTRVWCSILRLLSRYWQIESLYRSNAKYRPAWSPRFVCFQRASDLPRIGVASLRAEGFLGRPGRDVR